MKKAREEYKQKTETTQVGAKSVSPQTDDATVYDLSGRQVNTPHQGVFLNIL